MPSSSRGRGGQKQYRGRGGRGRGRTGNNGPGFAEVVQLVIGAAGAITNLINAYSDYRRQNQEITEHPEAVQHVNDIENRRRDGSLECIICKNSIPELRAVGLEIVATPCGHVYCRDCVVKALETKPECPSCHNHMDIQDLNTLQI